MSGCAVLGLVRSGGRGGRTFGFESDGVTHVPGETAVVREVFGRVLGGEGIRAIATGLAARGVTTTAGTLMHPIAVRRMIAAPRYAGLMPGGEQAGAWEPVVSRKDWEVAGIVTAARSGPVAAGHTARRHLLSGIAVCGVCGSGLQALSAYTRKRDGRLVAATYGCVRPGCRRVCRSLVLLDAYVSRRAVNRLANPLNPAAHPADVDLAREFAQLATERAATEATVRDYRISPGRVELLMARLDSIDARLAELRDLAAGDQRGRTLAAHTGITAAEFGELPLGSRRALIAACYEVRVLPASKRGPGVPHRGRGANPPVTGCRCRARRMISSTWVAWVRRCDSKPISPTSHSTVVFEVGDAVHDVPGRRGGGREVVQQFPSQGSGRRSRLSRPRPARRPLGWDGWDSR